MELRRYQREAGNEFWLGMRQYQRQVIVLPTGTGKTVLGLAIAKAVNKRTLWVAHRDELITQPQNTIKHIWPDVSSGIVKGSRNEHDRQVVFASVQTIQRQKRMDAIGEFGFVVIDECHHGVARTWRSIIDRLGCYKNGGPRLLGLTATPERTDNKPLSDLFERIAYVYHLTDAVKDGNLVPIKYETRSLELDLGGVKLKRNGDFDESDLDASLMRAGIVDKICDAVMDHKDRKMIVFVASVRQAEEVAEKLADKGVSAAAVSGETEISLRRARLRRFSSGDLMCIVSRDLLLEGYDEPSVNGIIMARPTTSKPLYVQAIGRGLRIYTVGGKTDCLVVDMVGSTKHHNLIQAPVLFGSGDDDDNKAKREYESDLDIMEYNERCMLLGQIKGLEPISRSHMRWVSCGDGAIAISAGQGGTVIARPSGDLWTVVAAKYGDVDLLVRSATLELAQGIAEDYVRRCEASGWAEKGARWRTEPATQKQIDLIKKMKKKSIEGITKGQASDILTMSMAESWRNQPATKKQLAALRSSGVSYDPDTITKAQARQLLYGGTNVKQRHKDASIV
jgi:superfamily II DNA or RNA helicase